MVAFFSKLFSRSKAEDSVPVIDASLLPMHSGRMWAGEKFPGGLSAPEIKTLDYWALRTRSAELFQENLYAYGLIRRLVTNEINTGLTPEASPDETVIGLEPGTLTEWAEIVESRFAVWAGCPELCDEAHEHTFGQLQERARLEALICGDVLVTVNIDRDTGAPRVHLISGNRVCTPLDSYDLKDGHDIIHGVEHDKRGRVIAYWVEGRTIDEEPQRIPAYGKNSGRRTAWLVFGTQRRLDEVRGTPLLSLVLQSLKELDRYRDSAQRKALVNSFLAMFIQKDADKPGTLPITGGAVKRKDVVVSDAEGTKRRYDISQHIPGLILEELQTGEKPVGFHNQGTDLNFPAFEEAIIQAVAWANEVPPEILRLAFSNNYSASQAAINEFKIYLNKFWGFWGDSFCAPVYSLYLLSQVLARKIEAAGMLEARRDPANADIFAAWVCADWYGSIKPSTDMFKQTKGSEMLVQHGWSTNARESRVTTGTKFEKNVKRLKRENEQLVEAMRPLREFEREYGGSAGAEGNAGIDVYALGAALAEQMEANA